MPQREPSPVDLRARSESESREDRKSPGRRDQPTPRGRRDQPSPRRETSPREEPGAEGKRVKHVRKREKPSGEEPRSAREGPGSLVQADLYGASPGEPGPEKAGFPARGSKVAAGGEQWPHKER